MEIFNRIMKMHAKFPDLISAFKEEPDAYDSFVAIVRFVFLISYLYAHEFFFSWSALWEMQEPKIQTSSVTKFQNISHLITRQLP
jgi:hypothetical protein